MACMIQQVFTASGARCQGRPCLFFCSSSPSPSLVTTLHFVWHCVASNPLPMCDASLLLSSNTPHTMMQRIPFLTYCVCRADSLCRLCVIFTPKKSLGNKCWLSQPIVELEQKFKKFLKVCIKEELFIVY